MAITAASAQAATVFNNDQHQVNIAGFIAGSAHLSSYDRAQGNDSDVDAHLSLGTSRLGVTYIAKAPQGNVRVWYENDWAGGGAAANLHAQPGTTYRLRHAAIFYDGWVVGHTTTGFANTVGGAETIDYTGLANPNSGASPSTRLPLLGHHFTLADGVTAGLFIEEQNNENGVRRSLPDLTANFKGRLGSVDALVAVRLGQFDDPATATGNARETEGVLDLTLGLAARLADHLTLKLAAARYGEDKGSVFRERTVVGVSGQWRISDRLRSNLVVQQSIVDADDHDSTAVWLNAFYRLPVGWEWGAELRVVSADQNVVRTATAAGQSVNGLEDGDTRISVQAKYTF